MYRSAWLRLTGYITVTSSRTPVERSSNRSRNHRITRAVCINPKPESAAIFSAVRSAYHPGYCGSESALAVRTPLTSSTFNSSLRRHICHRCKSHAAADVESGPAQCTRVIDWITLCAPFASYCQAERGHRLSRRNLAASPRADFINVIRDLSGT